MAFLQTTAEIPGFGRITTVEAAGEGGAERDRCVIPRPTRGDHLVVSVEGSGRVQLIINDRPVTVEWDDEARAFAGEEDSLHAFVATDASEMGSIELMIEAEPGASLTVRVLEVVRGATMKMLRRLGRFGRCKLCREILKALINAVLAFLGVPPGVFVPLDLDDLEAVIRAGAGAMGERIPRQLRDIADRLLETDAVGLLARLLKAALGMLDLRNVAARRACEWLGYCP